MCISISNAVFHGANRKNSSRLTLEGRGRLVRASRGLLRINSHLLCREVEHAMSQSCGEGQSRWRNSVFWCSPVSGASLGTRTDQHWSGLGFYLLPCRQINFQNRAAVRKGKYRLALCRLWRLQSTPGRQPVLRSASEWTGSLSFKSIYAILKFHVQTQQQQKRSTGGKLGYKQNVQSGYFYLRDD